MSGSFEDMFWMLMCDHIMFGDVLVDLEFELVITGREQGNPGQPTHSDVLEHYEDF